MADVRQGRPQAPPRTKSGAKSLSVVRGEHGFGFTLRHFLVYPPEAYRLRSREGNQPVVADEPMETMFVKKVTEGTSARAAGLKEGDRLISVNGEQVEGKTYKDVVRMIQNTPQTLHLVVVPKEHDVIQQHYKETAHNPLTNVRPRNASPALAESGGRLSIDGGASFSSLDSNQSLTDDSAIMSRIYRITEQKRQFLNQGSQGTPMYIPPREGPQGLIAREFYSRPQRLPQTAWPPDLREEATAVTSPVRSQELEHAREPKWGAEAPSQKIMASRNFDAESGAVDMRRHHGGIQLVSERTQQFESGALLDDKIRLYSNELARLSSRVAAPPVAVRRQEFEQRASVEPSSPPPVTPSVLSGNRMMPIGSSVLHVPPPPGYRDPVEPIDYPIRQRGRSSSTDRWSSFAEPPTTTSTPTSENRLSHPLRGEERLYHSLNHNKTPLSVEERLCQSLSPELDKQRHKVVRQESYLAAVKTLPGPTALRARRIIRRESTKETSSEVATDDVVPVRAPRPTTLSLRVPVNTVPTTTQAEGVVRRGRSALSVDERTSRRISYLKATSGEASDLPAKSSSMRWLYPMLPGELQRLRRLFEMYSGNVPCDEELTKESTPDAVKEGWVHWKLAQQEGRRAGDRSWKQMYARLNTAMVLSLQRDRQTEAETFDVTGWSVDIAENYTKRKNVLRLRTPHESEYLLQAEDSDDMERWRSALPARKSSQVMDSVPSPKSKTWRGKLGKPFRRIGGGAASPSSPTTAYPEGATIGVPLELCPPSPEDPRVPLLVTRCTTMVETYGLDTVGVYRVPGNAAAITNLTEAVNKGIHNVPPEDPRWRDVNVVSSLIKSFFRSLPDCLFTAELYQRFIEADKLPDKQERLITIRNLLEQLPLHNSATLHHVLLHLRKVVGNSSVNKMEGMNLAIVFGPTLVRPSTMTAMVIDTPHQCHIIDSLIRYTDWFFSTDDVTILNLEPTLVPTPTTTAPTESATPQGAALLLSNIEKLEGNTPRTDLVASLISAVASHKARNRPKKSDSSRSPMNKAQPMKIVEESLLDHPAQHFLFPSDLSSLAVTRKGGSPDDESLSMKRFKGNGEIVTSNASADSIHMASRQEEGPDLLASLTETFDQKLQGLKSAEDSSEKTSDDGETSGTEKAEIENIDEKDCKTRQEKKNEEEDKFAKVLRLHNDNKSRVKRSESLNKQDVVEGGAKVRRSESLGKHEYLTKTEKTESNMKARQKRSSCKEKENKRIKRRHTVGGTKDLDKLTWPDNRLVDSRTSSPELSTTQHVAETTLGTTEGVLPPLESHV